MTENSIPQTNNLVMLPDSLNNLIEVTKPSPPRHKGLVTICLADVKPEPVHWVWQNRIAAGKFNLIAGHPGLGKSLISTFVAAKVTTGQDWPDSPFQGSKGDVLIFASEDDKADTIMPRLIAAGADVGRCHYVEHVADQRRDNQWVERGFSLDRDLPYLAQQLQNYPETRLVIIDPVTAFQGDTDSHKNAEMRALFGELVKLASDYDVTILAVSHFNKGQNLEASISRVTGSIATGAVARSVYGVTKDTNNDERRLFLPIKNNLAPDTAGLAYMVETVEVMSGIKAPRLVWEAEPVNMSFDEAARQGNSSDAPSRKGAESFLSEYLSNGSKPASEVLNAGKEQGYSIPTLHRASNQLAVIKRKAGFDGGWEWSLPTG